MHPQSAVVFILFLQFLSHAQVNAQNWLRAGDIAVRHPYMASIRNNGRFGCAGVLISSHVVLTTARCVDPRYDRDALPEIWLNATQTHEPAPQTVFRKAVDSRIHPLYSGDIFEGYDFAVLLLNESAHELASISMPYRYDDSTDDRLDDGIEVLLLGYGRSSDTDAISPASQIGQLTLINPEICHNAEDIVFIEDQMYCAEGYLPCNGDQGGPIFRNATIASKDILVGMISVATCEYNQRVTAFLRTDNVDISNWIDEQLENLESLIPEDDLPPESDCTFERFLEVAQSSEISWDDLDCL